MELNFLCAGALFLDTLIGDPRGGWHPVVMIGNLISFLENLLLNAKSGSEQKKASGAFLVIITIGAVYLLNYAVVYLLAYTGHMAFIIGSMALVSFTISPRALREAGEEIYLLLASGDIAGARSKVGWIVGRDTQNLDEGEVTRATVETIAENITDGIISPLFYALLGGVPLAFAYRAVNTLDSMVGYKNEKYKDFGLVAARLDDVANFIPARITALLIIIAAFICPSCDPQAAAAILWRDAGKHPSPNSGYAEAPVAGALGIRLGGCNYYFGQPSFRAYMGDEKNLLKAKHIKETIYIMYTVTVLFVVLSLFI